jgi:hypothetical protein
MKLSRKISKRGISSLSNIEFAVCATMSLASRVERLDTSMHVENLLGEPLLGHELGRSGELGTHRSLETMNARLMSVWATICSTA